MPSLKDLRGRISSVSATRKITRAMQMVAAAKLRRAQQAVESARPYARSMADVLAMVGRDTLASGEAPPLLRGTGRDDAHLLVVCTSDKGLCGAFNMNIVKLVTRHVLALRAQGKKVRILCVGKKGAEALGRRFPDAILGTMEQGVISDGTVRLLAEEVGARVMRLFDGGGVDVCSMFFSRFRSVLLQVPVVQQLIPLPLEPFSEDEGSGESIVLSSGFAGQKQIADSVYICEPSEEEILSMLLPRNLAMQIQAAFLENVASEQGARMAAMDNATTNAKTMIERLTLQYNRQRQAQITKELTEIVSGAEAL